MDLQEIKKCETWEQLLKKLEEKFWGKIEHNLMVIEALKEQGKIYKTQPFSITYEIQELESTNQALAKILESKK